MSGPYRTAGDGEREGPPEACPGCGVMMSWGLCGACWRERAEAVITAAREMLAYPCTCHECWTGRGRHDPHGCIWAECADLRDAVAKLDEVPR